MPGSRLHAILGDVALTRCNHRYRLNDELIGPLKDVGVDICARGEHDRADVRDEAYGFYVDAIEASAHPFFIGMQGHPELSSSEAWPHPLLVAFLCAVQHHT